MKTPKGSRVINTQLPANLIQTVHFESVTLGLNGQIIDRFAGQALQINEKLAEDVVLELIQVPKGFSQMGSLQSEGGYEDEQPRHPLFLDSFWLGKYPLNQRQWQAVMRRTPPCRFHDPDLPVENVNWNEAVEFCKQLSKNTNRPYGLPSEAQWEYACRAGTSTPFNLGETLTTDYANYVGEHTYREAPQGIYRHSTTPGGAFPPNRWGLYDMHGNVWEFCQDNWNPDYVGAGVNGDARRGETNYRVARGGSWHETPGHCRSAMRLRISQDERLEYYGFRVMLEYA